MLSLVVLATLAGAPPEPRSGDWRAKVEAHVRANQAAIFREFVDLLALPNLASDTPGIRRNAEHIVGMLERRGVAARLLDGEGGPTRFTASCLAPGARRTVLFYAHYDGQPVDPAKWAIAALDAGAARQGAARGGPRPAPRLIAVAAGEWRLYARSTSDDKAPIVGFLAALDALKAAGVPSLGQPQVLLRRRGGGGLVAPGGGARAEPRAPAGGRVAALRRARPPDAPHAGLLRRARRDRSGADRLRPAARPAQRPLRQLGAQSRGGPAQSWWPGCATPTAASRSPASTTTCGR